MYGGRTTVPWYIMEKPATSLHMLLLPLLQVPYAWRQLLPYTCCCCRCYRSCMLGASYFLTHAAAAAATGPVCLAPATALRMLLQRCHRSCMLGASYCLTHAATAAATGPVCLAPAVGVWQPAHPGGSGADRLEGAGPQVLRAQQPTGEGRCCYPPHTHAHNNTHTHMLTCMLALMCTYKHVCMSYHTTCLIMSSYTHLCWARQIM